MQADVVYSVNASEMSMSLSSMSVTDPHVSVSFPIVRLDSSPFVPTLDIGIACKDLGLISDHSAETTSFRFQVDPLT